MSISHRRSNIEIIAEMLKVGENGAGKTRIMYNTNMSYAQIQKYLGFLISHGFITKMHVGNPSVTYQVTDTGLKLLKNIEGVIQILGWDILDG
ncbi:MAG: winged helix-turn-helix domain-containing protein [Chloroflexota bacterium]